MSKLNVEKYIEKKYNRLTIIAAAGKNEHGSVLVKCKCECYNFTVNILSDVKSARVRSCGCIREFNQGNRKHSLLYSEFLAAKRNNNPREMKSFNYKWELSFERYCELILQNCFYCGQVPQIKSKSRKAGLFLRNGIDRLDNNIGYINKNCVSCCKKCNFMKSKLDYNKFIEQCIKIFEFQKKKYDNN